LFILQVLDGATEIPVTGGDEDPDAQTYTINLGATLVVGQEYTVDITFEARVAEPEDRRYGLYLSTYTEGGVTK